MQTLLYLGMEERDRLLQDLIDYIQSHKNNRNQIQLDPNSLTEQLCDEGFLKCHGGDSGFGNKIMYSVYYTLDVAVSQGGRLAYLRKNNQGKEVISINGSNNQVVNGSGNSTHYSSSIIVDKNDKKPASIAAKIIKHFIVPIIVSVIAALLVYLYINH